jgi:hypothetical protein
MKRKRVAYVGVAIIAAVLFFVLAPVANPSQFGADICPHSSLSSIPYVSITYLYFKFGGVYAASYGYHLDAGSFC